jgi:hypothetical protein
MRTIQPLVFALLVDVVEVAKHFDGGDVRPRVVHHALGPVLDEIFEQLEGLCNPILLALAAMI